MAKKLSIGFLGLLVFLAIFRDILANGRPLKCRIGGETYYPGLVVALRGDAWLRTHPVLGVIEQQTAYESWKEESRFDDSPLYAPIPFSPGEYSTRNISGLLAPGTVQPGLSARFKHVLGTDGVGRDIAATLISGARVALLTGSVATLMALCIGLLLGTLAGYFGDEQLLIRRGLVWFGLAGIPVAWFFAFVQRRYVLDIAQTSAVWWESAGIFILVMGAGLLAGWLFSRWSFGAKTVKLPADLIIMRASELVNALPKLVIIISLSVLLQRQNDSIWLLIALIGALGWTGVARYVRAELLRIRELEYVQAARGLGMKEWRILFRHALPNAMRPVWVALAFGVGGAVTIEATLSFLGFGGESLKGISWGSLMALDNGGGNPVKSWWVMLPAGLMVCFTVLSFNTLGERMNQQ